MSQQIAHLEKKIGVKLFRRDKHSVELTNAGTVFLKDAKEILKRLDDSITNAKQAEEGVIGTLKYRPIECPSEGFFAPIDSKV